MGLYRTVSEINGDYSLLTRYNITKRGVTSESTLYTDYIHSTKTACPLSYSLVG